MRKRPVEFPNAAGATLRGDFYEPSGDARAAVLFAHCFACSASFKAPVRIARALCRERFAVLAFDFTGLGRSEGEFAETNFTTNVEDLEAAARWIAAERGAGPAVLVGHSLGGTAALAAAGAIPSSKAVVTIGAPASAAHVAGLLGDAREDIEARGEGRVHIGGRPFLIRKQLLDDIAGSGVPQSLSGLGRALLILHSPRDSVVSISEATGIFTRARHPKSFVSLDDADHLLSREGDAEYAAATIAAWAGRYIADAGRWRGGGRAERREVDAVVARTGRGGFATEVEAFGHALVADEPERLGGDDLGPSPYDLMAAALASCTSMTLQLYARRKRIPLDEAIVSVRHSRVHAEDCEDCESDRSRVDRFERVLELAGALTAGQRQRLLEIAERCPVHRTLASRARIDTRLAE